MGDKETRYTKTPWFYTETHTPEPQQDDYLIHDAEGRHIAEVFQYQNNENQNGPSQANAEFIVRACNLHEELLKACELVPKMIETLMDELAEQKATDWGIVNDGLIKVQRAVVKAKEQP